MLSGRFQTGCARKPPGREDQALCGRGPARGDRVRSVRMLFALETGPPGGEPGAERVNGFCDTPPAIPIAFADGSLRTYNQKFVGINNKLL